MPSVTQAHALAGAIICDPDGRNGGGFVVGRKSHVVKMLVHPQFEPLPPFVALRRWPIDYTRHDKFRYIREAIQHVSGVRSHLIMAESRKVPHVRVRAAFYIIARDLGWSLEIIGEYLSRDHSTVSVTSNAHRGRSATMSIVNKAKELIPDMEAKRGE
jgi:hypothetical protein